MDNSSELRFASPVSIRLAGKPLAPWLRLAHVSRYSAQATSVRLRELSDFELVLQLEGSAWIACEEAGGHVNVPSGSIAFIPPGFVHGWAANPGSHIAVHFDFQAQPDLEAMKHYQVFERSMSQKALKEMPCFEMEWSFQGSQSSILLPLVTALKAPRVMREKLEPLVQLYSRRAHHTSLQAEWQMQESIGWALNTIATEAAADRRNGNAAGDADPRILELLDELNVAPLTGKTASVSVEDLAVRARMGLTAFRTAFVRATGVPPHRYMERQRIDRAARAIVETERKINEIGLQEGYPDPYHFSRAFKRVMGVSPRTYRKKMWRE